MFSAASATERSPFLVVLAFFAAGFSGFSSAAASVVVSSAAAGCSSVVAYSVDYSSVYAASSYAGASS